MELNRGPLDNEVMARLFREIMSSCLALEQPLRVAYLGPEGTFSQAAALKHFGHAVISTPMAAIDEVFREVVAGAVNFGVVPVENSTEGAVNHTLDSFLEHDIVICGEVELRIHHHLLVGETTKTDRITRIYSHAQSLAQCRKWLDAHYPNVERVAVSSNADAAKRVKSEWNSAAIAGDMAAQLYGLTKLAERSKTARTTPPASSSSVTRKCRRPATTRRRSLSRCATSRVRCTSCWCRSTPMASTLPGSRRGRRAAASGPMCSSSTSSATTRIR